MSAHKTNLKFTLESIYETESNKVLSGAVLVDHQGNYLKDAQGKLMVIAVGDDTQKVYQEAIMSGFQFLNAHELVLARYA